ncbi:hypothetical protein Tco_0443721, partial [Tanacetum coccineum]
DDGEAVKGCYKKFIDMVQVYYETTKMPWYEKKPKEDVVETVKGCYKKFIDMVQVYYETTKMPWYEKKPKEDVVESMCHPW